MGITIFSTEVRLGNSCHLPPMDHRWEATGDRAMGLENTFFHGIWMWIQLVYMYWIQITEK